MSTMNYMSRSKWLFAGVDLLSGISLWISFVETMFLFDDEVGALPHYDELRGV